MPSVAGRVEVRCTLEQAWDLFSRFGDVATLIPSVESVEVDGDVVHAKVCTRLGALPISSRVRLEVIERKPNACLKAEGISYLGETVREQVTKVQGVDSESVGRMKLHLDLRSTETAGRIAVLYTAEVEAEGRLKRIYQAILKTKVPGMMEEFAQNLREALEHDARAGAGAAAARAVAATAVQGEARPEPATPAADAPASAAVAVVVRARWWARFVAWLRAVVARVLGG